MTGRGFIFSFFLVAVAFIGNAQPYTSNQGKFEVDQREGCAPFAVNITVLPPFNCTGQCDIDPYGDNNFINLVSPFVYDTPGTYWLRLVIGGSGGQNEVDSVQITVLPNIKPAFELYSCGNNEVSVRITDTNYDQYVVDYSDGASVTLAATNKNHRHAFAGPGAATVTVRGRNTGAADNCGDSTRQLNVVQTLPPPALTRVTVLDGEQIQLDFNTSDHILYRLEYAVNNNASFQLVKTVYNASSEILTNLRTDDNFYCFRLGAYDPCNNVTYYSATICSANVDLSVGNNVNNFSWDTNPSGVSGRRIRRVTTATGNVLTTGATGSNYADTDIECGAEYCYQLTLDYPGGAQSISLEKCGTAISTDIPDPVYNVTASVNLPGVSLEWQTPPGFTATEFFVRKISASSGIQVGATALPEFFDESFLAEESVCYQISYEDVCGNRSNLSDPACPIILTADLQGDNTVELMWRSYTGWRNGISGYVLEKYSLDGQLIQTINMGLALNFDDDGSDPAHQAYVYIVRAVPTEAGVSLAASNPVTVIKDPNLFYPTGFTPNGDNLNDTFNVFGQYVTAFQMSIFNRWGQLLYTTRDLDQGWDGTFNGQTMPEGTYTFVAEITDFAGRTFRKSGSFFLLEKGN